MMAIRMEIFKEMRMAFTKGRGKLPDTRSSSLKYKKRNMVGAVHVPVLIFMKDNLTGSSKLDNHQSSITPMQNSLSSYIPTLLQYH